MDLKTIYRYLRFTSCYNDDDDEFINKFAVFFFQNPFRMFVIEQDTIRDKLLENIVISFFFTQK